MQPSSRTASSLDDTETAAAFVRDYESVAKQGLSLDIARGKPSPEQLDRSNGLLTAVTAADCKTTADVDPRNYGNPQGLPGLRALFADILGTSANQVVAAGNSSLELMHDCIVFALLKGTSDGTLPWSKSDKIGFLCPVPGYDRHFAICEHYGIRLIPVPLTGSGPDMAEVTRLVADPSIKGMWCVPRYSNPTGETYAAGVVEQLATMPTGAEDFRIFWDDAYALHHLSDARAELPSLIDLCQQTGHPDRPFVFTSTSKVTFAGSGVAFFAASAANVRWYLSCASLRTIGPNKVNQLRHLNFLTEIGIDRLMQDHRSILAPKFQAVMSSFERRLSPYDIATWTHPHGGYFISLDVLPGTAKRVVALAKSVGLSLTPAGATFPGGHDPNDGNIRIAPTFPPIEDVKAAADITGLCTLIATCEARLGRALI